MLVKLLRTLLGVFVICLMAATFVYIGTPTSVDPALQFAVYTFDNDSDGLQLFVIYADTKDRLSHKRVPCPADATYVCYPLLFIQQGGFF